MDTASLREVCAHQGPFASVYLPAQSQLVAGPGPAASGPAWPRLRAELVDQGADETTLRTLGIALRRRSRPALVSGRALVAMGRDLLLDWSLAAPQQPVARWSALPYLMPIIEHGPDIAHVVLLVHYTTAELMGCRGDQLVEQTTVIGRQEPAHPMTVRHTAELVRDMGAEVLVVAGQPMTRASVRRALPARCKEILVDTDLGAGADHDGWPLRQAVREIVLGMLHQQEHDLIDWFRAELAAPQSRTTQGLPEVLAAFSLGNVGTAFVSQPQLADRTISVSAGAVSGLPNGSGRTRLRADELIPAAAAATGAHIVLAPELPLTDGVGALLRSPTMRMAWQERQEHAMPERGSTKHSPRQDDELRHQTEGMIRSNRPSDRAEWRDPEPPADDDPQPRGWRQPAAPEPDHSGSSTFVGRTAGEDAGQTGAEARSDQDRDQHERREQRERANHPEE